MGNYRRKHQSSSVQNIGGFAFGGLIALAVWFMLPADLQQRLQETARASVAPASKHTSDDEHTYAARFTYCNGPSVDNCVVDGDTFHFQGQKIRIADIDTPELHPARCDYERALGLAAKDKLLALLNEAPFQLTNWDDRDEDKYGRKLRVVMRNGKSLGGELVEVGLARHWEGKRRSWCE